MSALQFIRNWWRKYSLSDVFTPSSVAKANYISRVNLETEFKKNLSIPGKQIIIFGLSGSGKTTLTRHMLACEKQNFIQTQCDSKISFEQLLLNAFDQLDRFYVDQKKSNSSYKISTDLKLRYGSVKQELMTTTELQEKRLVNPQLTISKLAEFLGAIQAVWLIEDFHVVSDDVKSSLADALKIFMDSSADHPRVRIICIGAVGSASEMIKLAPDLKHRITEFKIPLLSDDEIDKIIIQGCKLLNIEIEPSLIEGIRYYSNHLGALVHQMCFDICHSVGINEFNVRTRCLKRENLGDGISAYMKNNEDTFKVIYDSCVSKKECWYILKTLDVVGHELFLDELMTRINRKEHHFSVEEIKSALEDLSTPGKGVIRFDANSQKYSISTPFWEAFIKIQMQLEQENNTSKKKRVISIYNQSSPEADIYNELLKYMLDLRKQQMESFSRILNDI